MLLLNRGSRAFCYGFGICDILWISVFFAVENLVDIGKQVLQEQKADLSKAR